MRPVRFVQFLGAAALALAGATALAQDVSWSTFGTIGYAQSNREFHSLRNIDRGGTLETDTLFGAQGDLRFTPQWSATVQVKLAQSLKADDRWDLTPSWAFLAWRPVDDWLVRAGKMRVPLYLQSESMEVGATHDMARLPAEMYWLVPSTDFVGLALAKNWAIAARDLSLDLYSGSIDTTARFWLRDGAPPQAQAGANFIDVKVRASGAVLSLRSPQGTLRGGAHRVRTRLVGTSFPSRYPFVEVSPGVGYYQVTDALPGPGIPSTDSIHNNVYTLGVEHVLVRGWRIAAEYARNVQYDTEMGFASRGGYVALFHEIGRFTPYVSWGTLKSSDGSLAWSERLMQNKLPAFVPGADSINAAQRVAGEFSYAVDQHSTALGTSYAIDARQKVKAEWLHTRVGRMSRFVDTPPGNETPANTSIDTFSASYSFSF